MEHVEVARAAAQAWDPTAVLYSAFAGEVPEGDLAEESAADDDDAFTQAVLGEPDPEVGDGLSPRWGYGFRNDADDQYYVVVADSGQIVYEGPADESDDLITGELPITGWNIDSDEAMQIIKDATENASALLGFPDAFVVNSLGQEHADGHPLWAIVILSEQREAGSIFIVDANNGSFVEEVDFGDLLEDLFRSAETGGVTGQITLATTPAKQDFVISDPEHAELLVTLVTPRGVPTTEVTLTVTGPQGRTASVVHVVDPIADAFSQVALPTPAAGGWTATLDLDAGVAQEFELLWCATGFYIHVFGHDPCQHR